MASPSSKGNQELPDVLGTTASGNPKVVAMAAGYGFSVAVKSDGTVWTWGNNDMGQLGDGTTTARRTAVQVVGLGGAGHLTGVVAVSACSNQSVALRSDGTVWAWGDNSFFGSTPVSSQDTMTNQTSPVQIVGPGGKGFLTDVIAVSAGKMHAVAVKSDGTVWAWGGNVYHQFGDNTTTSSTVPVQVRGLTGVVAVAAGSNHTLALKSDGTVWAWGYKLGGGTTASWSAPVQVADAGGSGALPDIVAVKAGLSQSVALKSDGTVWAWGGRGAGQFDDVCGTAAPSGRITPGQVSGLTDIVAVAAGYHDPVALKADGTVWAWGSGTFLRAPGFPTNVPVQVSGLSGVAAVATGLFHALALKSDGTLWAWGANEHGELGDGTNADFRPAPVQVIGLSGRVNGHP